MSSYWELLASLLLMPILIGVAYGVLRLLGCVVLFSTIYSSYCAPIEPIRKLNHHPLPSSTNRILLLKIKQGISVETADGLPLSLGLKAEKHPTRLKQWRKFSIPPGKDKQDIIKTLERSGKFSIVQEPRTYTTQETIPNDPMFPQLWGMTNIMAPAAWDRIKEAPDVVVAVVDTGIDFSHPDLVDNLWTGPDGEHGYVATNGIVLPGGFDDHGHGTHVAGTIGAVGNNSTGVVGLAWKTRIMAMKVLHGGIGNSIDIVNACEKMAELRASGVPLLVSNHSYGGNAFDPYMEDGFRLLDEADIVCAVAAGNSGQNIDVNPFSPAVFSFNNIIVALASEQDNRKASFSNFGLIGSDIAAPGVGIWSTTRNNTYSAFSGTSMASPHVAGLAVLVRQLNRSLTASQTREVILHPNSYDSGDYSSSTGGKINATKTVNNPKAFEAPFVTNRPPHIESITPYALINSTKPVIIQSTGSDPDGDTLKWNATLSGLNTTFERRLLSGGLFVSNINNLTVISGGPYAYQLASELTIGASDQRGGSALTNSGFEFVRDGQLRKPIPLKTWTVTTNATDNSRVTVTLDVDDQAKTNYVYGLIMNFPGNRFGSYWANNPSPTPFSFYLGGDSSGFSIRAFIMDRHLNWMVAPAISHRTNSLDSLPKCVVTVTTNEGNVPMAVTFDLSKSERVQHYAVYDMFAAHMSQSGPVQVIPFDIPAMYFKMPLVYGTTPGEIDLTVVPIFASRFLSETNPPPPPSRLARLAVQKSSQPDGPWSTLTNLADLIHGDTFYRLEAQ